MIYTAIINEDEKIIQHICEDLNDLFYNIMLVKPNFLYIGSKEKGYFTIYNDNTYGKNIDLSLNFRLYYPHRNSYVNHKEAKSLKSKDLNKYIEAKHKGSGLLYVKIEWFSVNPRRNGIGSEITESLLDILKNTTSIEFILLTPKTPGAKAFWIKNKFKEEDLYISLDKRVESAACKRLVYKI